MELADFHTHTKYSFDSMAEPEDIVLSAIKKGLRTIAITDHADVDCEDQGLSWDFSFVGRKKCINDLKEKYKDKIKVLHGMEIGQPYNRTEFSAELVKQNEFDFVLGSVHNLTAFPDFCFLRFDHIPQDMTLNLLKRYVEENIKLTKIDYVDVIGHITYPLRYVYLAGAKVDIAALYCEYEKLLKEIVNSGKIIEINTSTLRKGLDFTMPSKDLLDIYKSVGGKFVTIGSDAHCPEDVGANIEDGVKLAQNVGLEAISDFSK